MNRDASTFSLIGERYLDTQHEASYAQELDAELAARGIVGVRRAACEYVAASALWWNVLWWEWIHLDQRDVRLGWIQNVVLFSVAAVAIGYFMGGVAAVVSVLLLHGLTLMLGLGLRSGSIAPQPPKRGDAT